MPIYTCECCNFNTKIKSHLSRHYNTKKHQANNLLFGEIDEFSVMSQKEPKKSPYATTFKVKALT